METKPADEVFLDTLLSQNETSGIEFRAATNSYSVDKAISYGAAIANEGGGYFVLGVSDSMPRGVLSTSAVVKFVKLGHRNYEKLGIKLPIRAISYKGRGYSSFRYRRAALPHCYPEVISGDG